MSQWDDDAQLLTVDVARVLQISASAVIWLASTGRLPCTRSVGGVRIWRWRVVRNFRDIRERARVLRPRVQTVAVRHARSAQYALPLGIVHPQRLPAAPPAWRKRELTIDAIFAERKRKMAKAVLQAPTVKARANRR
jgi:hypothetical protein